MAVLNPGCLVHPLRVPGHPDEGRPVLEPPGDVDGGLVVGHQSVVGVDQGGHHKGHTPGVAQDTDAIVKRVTERAPGTEVVIMKPGESYEFQHKA